MKANFEDLVALMALLRSPEGCPWDREQNYETLAPMLLEEAYEAFDAVERAREGNPEELRDELGDLLFQIVFYAQVAMERGEFSIEDVTNSIHTKMVRRHPHVFGEIRADTSTEVLKNWETIKAEEKLAGRRSGEDTSKPMLDEVPSKMPALMEAHQLSKKAANVGFDWEKIEDIFDKIQEEVEELREAITLHKETSSDKNLSLVRGEVGDLLFAVANIGRHLKVEPEAALKLTNRKFRKRFGYIEEQLKARGVKFNDTSLEELEALWQEGKKTEVRG
jgi:MazG family protein